ncbi:MAG: hypothetical protein DRO46_04535 [Candidatus Hecatellales archaeon]|nr:MAG: hypothetical protein DRO46_04535 [Candidatus Hecatellales archaeon]
MRRGLALRLQLRIYLEAEYRCLTLRVIVFDVDFLFGWFEGLSLRVEMGEGFPFSIYMFADKGFILKVKVK